MKNNIYYENRKEIYEIGMTQGVDAGIATIIYAKANNLDMSAPEYQEWKDEMAKYEGSNSKTLADLFK